MCVVDTAADAKEGAFIDAGPTSQEAAEEQRCSNFALPNGNINRSQCPVYSIHTSLTLEEGV